jgi:hypothetical protein
MPQRFGAGKFTAWSPRPALVAVLVRAGRLRHQLLLVDRRRRLE